MIIRKANAQDFSVIYEYIKKLWSYNSYDEIEVKKLFADVLNDPNSFVFILEDDGFKGFIHGCFMNTFWMSGKTCYISSLYVDESEREKGYGKQLMEYIKEYSGEKKCKAIILDSGFPRKKAHEFYENLGYEKSCYGFELIM